MVAFVRFGHRHEAKLIGPDGRPPALGPESLLLCARSERQVGDPSFPCKAAVCVGNGWATRHPETDEIEIKASARETAV
jgi:hypothetical protein